jgi:uncharacterized protein (DUF433 family)/DNA-binding transcriptional MerR regulator
MAPRGAYPADRAAALSGVPRSTVHDWARKEVLVPSISAERRKLWSYGDLMGLRLVYWLRHPKRLEDDTTIPASPMSEVRKALEQLRSIERERWTAAAAPVVAVDHAGGIVFDPTGSPVDLTGQSMFGDHKSLNLVLPFETEEGTRGPDLLRPRPSLRIIPGKLGGEPHVARSRVETRALAALARRGMDAGNIVRLYPALEQAAVVEAIDLEDQLARNLSVPLAA